MATSNPEWVALQNLTDALCELWRTHNTVDLTAQDENTTALERV